VGEVSGTGGGSGSGLRGERLWSVYWRLGIVDLSSSSTVPTGLTEITEIMGGTERKHVSRHCGCE